MGQNSYTITAVRRRSTMHCTTLGIDVAKQVFQLHGVDEHGHVVVQKRVVLYMDAPGCQASLPR